jgi:predicted nucleic acid-binding protein
MRRLVMDASVAVSWFLEDGNSEFAKEVRGAIPDCELVCVPAHWMLEVVNALLMAERRKRIAAAAVNHATGLLRQLPVRFDPQTHDQAGGTDIGTGPAARAFHLRRGLPGISPAHRGNFGLA